jgi:hypothetical protein
VEDQQLSMKTLQDLHNIEALSLHSLPSIVAKFDVNVENQIQIQANIEKKIKYMRILCTMLANLHVMWFWLYCKKYLLMKVKPIDPNSLKIMSSAALKQAIEIMYL